MFGQPPEAVPDGLTAGEYYELGIWYEEAKLLAQARESLTRALSACPDETLARQCKILLATRIPRYDVPQGAISKLRLAELERTMKPEKAKKTLEKLIVDYPEFEWAYRGLADFYLHEGDLGRCTELLQRALQINPDDASALTLMARALIVDMEYESAATYLKQASAAMPDAEELRRLQRSLDFLIALEQIPLPRSDN